MSRQKKKKPRPDERDVVDVVETCQCFADGELAVEGQLLGHVADARAGDARLGRALLAAEDEHLARVETAPADDATQQRRLAATAGSQQSVTARARPIKQSAHQQHWLPIGRCCCCRRTNQRPCTESTYCA